MITSGPCHRFFYIALLFCITFFSNCNNRKSEEAINFLNSKYKSSVLKLGRGNEMEITVDFSTENSIDEEDLKVLKEIDNITVLHFCECPISKKGIKYLTSLKKLRVLTLHKTNLTDDGLQMISQNFLKLEKLEINNTNVSSEGFRYISKLSKLQDLELRSTKIDNKSIQYLCELNNLGYLGLSSTKISNDSIPYLKQFRAIKVMFIINTQISKEGYLSIQDHYKKINPKISIVWDPNDVP